MEKVKMNTQELAIMLFIKGITAKKENLKVNKGYQVWIDDKGNRFIHGRDNKFNMVFIKKNGFTAKWGETFDEDPAYNPYGNEIADIEITKRCQGIRGVDGVRRPCPWCYKQNVGEGDYMSFETFKELFDKINNAKTMTQIAFGTDASLLESSNPDYWKIFEYAKANGVTPNVTIADVDETTAKKMAKTFGACAVSYYAKLNKERCYNSVERIVNAVKEEGRQMAVNIHALVSKETYDSLFELINDYKNDKRLSGMGAIVFLSLKQKGRGVHFNKVSDEQFKKLIDKCFAENVRFGMDSCSANKFLKAIKDRPDYEKLVQMVEPCEACQFSSYFDCYGNYFPCSFMEKEGEWKNGIPLKDISCINDIWYEQRVRDWRKESIKNIKCLGCNKCHFYDV